MLNLRGESGVATLEMTMAPVSPERLAVGSGAAGTNPMVCASGKKNRIVYAFCCGADYILNVVPARAATYNPRTQLLRRSLDTEPHRKIPRFGSRPSPGRPRASGVVLQLICPTSGRAKLLSTPCRKNICLFRNSDLPYSRSAPREGRLAIAADVVRNVVDGSVS